jgi:hypothetical protein
VGANDSRAGACARTARGRREDGARTARVRREDGARAARGRREGGARAARGRREDGARTARVRGVYVRAVGSRRRGGAEARAGVGAHGRVHGRGWMRRARRRTSGHGVAKTRPKAAHPLSASVVTLCRREPQCVSTARLATSPTPNPCPCRARVGVCMGVGRCVARASAHGRARGSAYQACVRACVRACATTWTGGPTALWRLRAWITCGRAIVTGGRNGCVQRECRWEPLRRGCATPWRESVRRHNACARVVRAPGNGGEAQGSTALLAALHLACVRARSRDRGSEACACVVWTREHGVGAQGSLRRVGAAPRRRRACGWAASGAVLTRDACPRRGGACCTASADMPRESSSWDGRGC